MPCLKEFVNYLCFELRMGFSAAIKMLSGFDFSFQSSLDRKRILTLGVPTVAP